MPKGSEEIVSGNLNAGPGYLGIEFPALTEDCPMPDLRAGFRRATDFGYSAVVVDGITFDPLAHLCGSLIGGNWIVTAIFTVRKRAADPFSQP